jgi:hypothetical protein
MTTEIKTTLLLALDQYRGDDYERAKAAFRGYSVEEMNTEHGHSGQTRKQILDGYAAHAQKVHDARKFVEGL